MWDLSCEGEWESRILPITLFTVNVASCEAGTEPAEDWQLKLTDFSEARAADLRRHADLHRARDFAGGPLRRQSGRVQVSHAANAANTGGG